VMSLMNRSPLIWR